MSGDRAFEPMATESEQPYGRADLAHSNHQFTFRGPWFCSREAAAYIPCRSLNAFYQWRRRHGVIARSNGSVAKADLDRILRRRKQRRVMAAASLANLRNRKIR